MMCRLEKTINEKINKNIESLRAEMRASLAEFKNSINQMQSKLDTLTARVNEAEERISEQEDGMLEEKGKTEAWLKKTQSRECRLWEITDSMKHSNIRIVGIPQRVEKERSRRDI